MCAPRRCTLSPAQSNHGTKTAHSHLTLIFTWARRGAQPPTVRPRSSPRSGTAALPPAHPANPAKPAHPAHPANPAHPAKPAPAFACAVRDSPETSKPILQRPGRNSKLVLLQQRVFGEVRAAYRSIRCSSRATNSVTKLSPAVKRAAKFETPFPNFVSDSLSERAPEHHKTPIWDHSLKYVHPQHSPTMLSI